MLKYLTKFAMDIFPSVAATIIGAYIVNHYITKPGANAPAAAAVSTVEPGRGAAKGPVKAPAKPSETSSDLANVPEAGVKAKGISEKTLIDKAAAEKAVDKPADKSPDKPSETASIPVETRRHQPAPREKAASKTASTPVQASAPAVAPAPTTSSPVDATSPAEDRPDANELARAAIERLRGANEGSSRVQEATRVPDAARSPDVPHVVPVPPASAPLASAPPLRPLPPPIMVSTPSGEALDPATGSSPVKPPYAAERAGDPSRPTPPADIPPAPASQPLDLHAEAVEPPPRERGTVAEEVLSAAKSVFHAVLPK
jgi:hypothetical protein